MTEPVGPKQNRNAMRRHLHDLIRVSELTAAEQLALLARALDLPPGDPLRDRVAAVNQRFAELPIAEPEDRAAYRELLEVLLLCEGLP